VYLNNVIKIMHRNTSLKPEVKFSFSEFLGCKPYTLRKKRERERK